MSCHARIFVIACCVIATVLSMSQPLPAGNDGIYAIAIHGGAGGDPAAWDHAYRQQRRDGLAAALDAGLRSLKAGGAAIDVVEQVVRIMEDNEVFNAGRGCVLTASGEHELDAAIMDGRTLACGAVAGVTRARNPVSLARKVMTETKHVLLIGAGADEFGESVGLEQAPAEYFRIERQKSAWRLWQQQQLHSSMIRPKFMMSDDQHLYLGTVGCVARDQFGNLAAATSTGGLLGKRKGRVGDAPVIGAGTYADNRTCAVSGTGVGEEFIRHRVAGDIAARIRYAGRPLSEAAHEVVHQILPEECGGVIAVDAAGHIAMEFNTPGMSRAAADSHGRSSIALDRNE